MKKIYIGIIMLLMSLSLIKVDVIAASAYNDDLPRVVDESDLLTDSEEEKLEKKLDKLRNKWDFDIVVVTVDSLSGYSAQDFADDYFDYQGYGYGSGSIDRDGIMFLISMREREWYISTSGSGIKIFTDYGIDFIGGKVLSDLSAGYYYSAFDTYADYCDEFINHYEETGSAYDVNHKYKTKSQIIFSIIIRFIISLIIGLIVALIRVGGMKAKMNTVNKKYEASDYVDGGKITLTDTSDNFVRTAVSKTVRETSSSSGGSGRSGGSSTHTSSSGGTHGGSGGHF